MIKGKLITSECVCEGHPDKMCDIIADTFVEEAVKQDPNSRMAVECTIKDRTVFIYGEANTKAKLDYACIALDVLFDIMPYESDKEYEVIERVYHQSNEITELVEDSNKGDLGAGDQGIVFGYARKGLGSTGLANFVATELARKYTELARSTGFKYFKADAKVLVTVDEHQLVCGKDDDCIKSVLISAQHAEDYPLDAIRVDLNSFVESYFIDKGWNIPHIEINPKGSFVEGGAIADSGTTGRKIVVDSYGGYSRVGGGALSSKDLTKVDRSGAYLARYVAKHIVEAGLVEEVEVQFGYIIGYTEPVSINVSIIKHSIGNSMFDKANLVINLENSLSSIFDLSVGAIFKLDGMEDFSGYQDTARYGHFLNEDYLIFNGKDLTPPWEIIDTNKVFMLRDSCKSK